MFQEHSYKMIVFWSLQKAWRVKLHAFETFELFCYLIISTLFLILNGSRIVNVLRIYNVLKHFDLIYFQSWVLPLLISQLIPYVNVLKIQFSQAFWSDLVSVLSLAPLHVFDIPFFGIPPNGIVLVISMDTNWIRNNISKKRWVETSMCETSCYELTSYTLGTWRLPFSWT